jgi:hypothetical protein
MQKVMVEKFTGREDQFFEISKDKISQARLKALLEAKRKIQLEFQDLKVGFSLWGSLAKGKWLELLGGSDIDIDIFIDNTSISKVLRTNYQNRNNPRKYNPNLSSTINGDISDKDEYYLKARVVEAVVSSLKNRPECDFDCSRNFGLLQNINVNIFYPNFLKELFSKSDQIGDRIATVFGYDVGGGMRFFIHKILNLIGEQELGKRDKLWKRIYDSCIVWHKSGKISTELIEKLPKTFTEACDFYGYKPM